MAALVGFPFSITPNLSSVEPTSSYAGIARRPHCLTLEINWSIASGSRSAIDAVSSVMLSQVKPPLVNNRCRSYSALMSWLVGPTLFTNRPSTLTGVFERSTANAQRSGRCAFAGSWRASIEAGFLPASSAPILPECCALLLYQPLVFKH